MFGSISPTRSWLAEWLDDCARRLPDYCRGGGETPVPRHLSAFLLRAHASGDGSRVQALLGAGPPRDATEPRVQVLLRRVACLTHASSEVQRTVEHHVGQRAGFPEGRPNAGVVYLLNSIFTRERVTDFLQVDLRTVLHEIGHVLGIGTLWSRSGFLKLDVDRPEFTGPRATAEYRRVSPRSTASARSRGVEGVPVEDDGAHWRTSAYEVDGDVYVHVSKDLMTPGGNRSQNNLITAVTVGTLDDLGYEVDYAQADCEAPEPGLARVLCDETLHKSE